MLLFMTYMQLFYIKNVINNTATLKTLKVLFIDINNK